MPDADAEAIARRAMDLAAAFLDTDSKKLAAMADGNPEALREAARIVRDQPQRQTRASLSPEHLAFTLITAAYERLHEESQPEPGA